MKSMLEELKDVKIKKHTVTSIEYDCKSEEKEDAVFDQVHNIVTNHLDDFAKITFDVEAIKGAGLITETPVIITNQDDFQADVEGNLPRNIKCGDILMIIHRTK